MYKSIFVPTLRNGRALWVLNQKSKSEITTVERKILGRLEGVSTRWKTQDSA